MPVINVPIGPLPCKCLPLAAGAVSAPLVLLTARPRPGDVSEPKLSEVCNGLEGGITGIELVFPKLLEAAPAAEAATAPMERNMREPELLEAAEYVRGGEEATGSSNLTA